MTAAKPVGGLLSYLVPLPGDAGAQTLASAAGRAPAPAPRLHSASSAQTPPAQIQLLIEFDEASARFVHIVLDAANDAVVRRSPSESQLAFSRGVAAYMKALAARDGLAP